MSIGPLQIILIIVLVLILFGAGKLPRVMGDIGKGIKSFRKGLTSSDDNDDNIDEEVKKLEDKKHAVKMANKKKDKEEV